MGTKPQNPFPEEPAHTLWEIFNTLGEVWEIRGPQQASHDTYEVLVYQRGRAILLGNAATIASMTPEALREHIAQRAACAMPERLPKTA